MSVLLQAKGGLGFFEPMLLPAAGTPKEQGANKRKSMDLGTQPDQDGELAQVYILSPYWTCCMVPMQQGAKRRRCICLGECCCHHGYQRLCFAARLLAVPPDPSSFMFSCTERKVMHRQAQGPCAT